MRPIIKIDTVKAVATYTIGAYIVWRVLDMLAVMVTTDPQVYGAAALAIIGAAIASVTAYLFGLEQGKQQSAIQQKALETGLTAKDKTDGP